MPGRYALLASAVAIGCLTWCELKASAASGVQAKILQGHSGAVTGVAFSPDGRTLASASADATIGLWDVKTGRALTSLSGHGANVSSIAFSPDGKALASGSNDAGVMLWDLATGQAPSTLSAHTAKVKCLAFSPDGVWLASGGADRTICLWDAKTGALKTTLEGHARGVLCLAFSPDGKTLASGSADESVKIWSVERAREETPAPFRGRNKRGPIVSLAYSPDGGELALATPDTVEVWEPGRSRRQFALKTEKGSTWWNARYAPQGALFAIGSGVKYARAIRVNTKHGVSTGSYQAKSNEISLWDAKTGREIRRFKGHQEPVRAIALSPDGTLLASGSNDKTVMLWTFDPDPKSNAETPATEVAASRGQDGLRPPPESDALMQSNVAAPAEPALLSDVEGDRRIDSSVIGSSAESPVVDLSQSKYFEPDSGDQSGSCASDFVVWLSGGGSFPFWDDAPPTKTKANAQRASSGSRTEKVKAAADAADLFRFDPNHAKSSWLGYREEREPPAKTKPGAGGGASRVSHSGGLHSAGESGRGQREAGFFSRAGRSLELGIRGGFGGGGGAGGGGGRGGGPGGHEEHEKKK